MPDRVALAVYSPTVERVDRALWTAQQRLERAREFLLECQDAGQMADGGPLRRWLDEALDEGKRAAQDALRAIRAVGSKRR